jgi:uncharacterized protein (DUF1697 family)
VTTYVALIRGINVGGKKTVAMARLRGGLAEAGLTGVSTYIQSGNVIATSRRSPEAVAALVEDVIEEQCGFRPAVVVRTRSQLAAAVERHPFLDRTDDRAKLHVLFCRTKPAPAALAAIDHTAFAPDELAVRGAELFAYYPNGAGRSKLVIDEKALGTPVTARNLRTVAKLVDLAS